VSIDNRRGVFPIHRSLRLLLLTSSRGGTTAAARGLLGADDPAVLETLPDTGGHAEAFPVRLTTALLRRVSGPRLAVPHVRSTADLALLDRLFSSFPALSDPAGWAATFGRELNATDDRDCFTAQADDLPVVEGRHLSPFRIDFDAVRLRASQERVARRIDGARTFERERLAYRDVASATNRQTLIAAILPPHAISVHTVFCLRTPFDAATQRFLCGVLNSFVANWIARLWVQTHVTVALVARLPVPRVDVASRAFRDIVKCVRRLEAAGRARGGAGETPRVATLARLQALVARLYGLSETEFGRVVGTFPLVEEAQRQAAIEAMGVVTKPGT
jgi:hypothetical protein